MVTPRTRSMVALMAMLCASNLGAAGADGFPKWPLRNGDFSTTQGWGIPAHWSTATNSGKFTFKTDPPAEFGGRPSAAIVEAVESGSAYFYQFVPLMKGEYRLSVQVSGTDGAKAQATFAMGEQRAATEAIGVTGEWQTLSVDVSTEAGDASVGLVATASAGQTVRFSMPRMDIERLATAPVPCSTLPPSPAVQIGAVVLPEHATLAEQFAGYELQRCVFKMTGQVPGVKGRDPTFDGMQMTIGRAAPMDGEKLGKLANDSYAVRLSGDGLALAGNTDPGTLYAVYDFLHHQGCRWVVPGEIGEVVPRRQSLDIPAGKVESPDYDCRGIMQLAQDFNPGGGEEFGWIYISLDDYLDWLLRNRLNGFWIGGVLTYDFGEHRGGSWVQLLNHSYNSVIAPYQEHFDDHPEWYPLIDGERQPRCELPPQFPNQLCVSSEGLRDVTMDYVLPFFRDRPSARAFPLNPMDGPSLWCECDACKELDPPGIDWSKHASEGHVKGMSDRALNYANEIADRLAKVYPDKLIEMYAYGYTLDPPVKEKVHKNVIIKYANLSGGRGTGPLGRSIMDEDNPIWAGWREQLEGWKKAGATLAWYNYLEWEHPDVSLFWFYNMTDTLKHLNRRYNCRMLAGENENNVMVSPMLYNVIARTVWDVDTDYKEVIRDLCEKFYGPVGTDMIRYNMAMDEAIRGSEAWKEEGWRPNNHVDIPLAVLEQAREMLEAAAASVKDDEILSKRLAYARFGHAYLTYVSSLNQEAKTPQTAGIARRAFDSANALRAEFTIMTKLPSVQQLKSFYYPPLFDEASVLMSLSETWKFRKDPEDKGLPEQWFAGEADASWDDIRITQDWTSQPAGRDYHGVAWYETTFNLPADAETNRALVLQFGAVDGIVDAYLDGVKFGEQKASPGAMWDKPFSIPLPSGLDTSKPCRLTLRVEKHAFAAGVWKPVKITRVTQE